MEEIYNKWQLTDLELKNIETVEFTKEELLHFANYYYNEQLRIGFVKSLPIQELPNCTRVEVIDQNGRSYVNWKPTNKVRLSMQDDGRTAKIFID